MIDKYLDNQTNIENYVDTELLAMIDSIEYAKMLCEKAVQGLLIGRNENPTEVALDTALITIRHNGLMKLSTETTQ